MSFKSIFSIGLLASTAAASTIGDRSQKFSCGAPEPSAEHKQVSQLFAGKESFDRAEGRVSTKANINVGVYMHVVTDSEDQFISDDVLNQQLAVLNEDYAASGVSFNLLGIDKTANPAWSQDGAEVEMKSALRKGDYGTLNLYYLTYLSGYLGYCYFPTDAPEGSNDFTIDGCSILADTVPGGPAEGYNLGKTTTHEVGHWLGLFHTFQDGCNGGDQVDDTPAQDSPSSGCPTGRDSCPNQEGLDPIHNYMDYSTDECYEEFTAGQNQRIQSFWSYRS